MELIGKSGRGYVPVENVEKKKFELGIMAIDAVFSPVKNVNFDVENVRVGQMTNFDRLIMSIYTDGTITPEEALRLAAHILVDHFSTVGDMGKESAEKKPAPEIMEQLESKEETEKTELQGTEEKPKKKRGRPKKES
jgi:DNA-directed RNA polymerase subunit alpha